MVELLQALSILLIAVTMGLALAPLPNSDKAPSQALRARGEPHQVRDLAGGQRRGICRG